MKLLIKGGVLVESSGERKADLLISDGKIAKIAPKIEENLTRTACTFCRG